MLCKVVLWRRCIAILLLCFLAVVCGVAAYAEDIETSPADPCSASNPNALFSLLDRPTFSDSACAVPFGHAVLELGYMRANLRGEGGGKSDSYPQTEVRIGLPGQNEIKFLAPNYTSQRSGNPPEAASGLSAAAIGIKHVLGYTDKWIGSIETVLTLPSGNDTFGSRGLGATLSGIAAYSVSDDVGISMQLGIGSLTDPVSAGGKRFTTFNQFLALTWSPIERLQLYGEVYGQTKTSRDEGAGFNFDGGLQYLVTHWLEIDVETGVRLSGNLGGFRHFYGAGVGILF
ncbi:MAG TPA: transporter [Dissulfurispiraceae bacterium]|nr:transporter [Dissulfurispiraceae bacterium]